MDTTRRTYFISYDFIEERPYFINLLGLLGRATQRKNQIVRKEENAMNKIGKVVRTQCYCGRYFNNATGEWQGASKHQSEMDKKLAEQGHLQIKLILCPECSKERK